MERAHVADKKKRVCASHSASEYKTEAKKYVEKIVFIEYKNKFYHCTSTMFNFFINLKLSNLSAYCKNK